MAASIEQHYPESGATMEGTPLKLFVGQVPKDMDEDQLRPLFEQAGPIAHIMVIRDRQTDAHRGCAFLTYQTREAGERAVDKFHNKVKLPNAHNPVQVRPADSQMGDDRLGPNGRVAPVDRENKLFVGMLPHDADDMTLTEVFSRFGEITEIYCMRNPDGTPKGCAFVKFSTRSAAIAAIEALHEKCTMDGATRALVVKFADVKKAQTAKGWMVPPDGRGASPLGYNGRYHGGGTSVGGYWQATGAPGGRDVYSKGREVYPDYGSHHHHRGYPYQPGYSHVGPPGGGYSQSYGPEYHHPGQPQAPSMRGHGGYVYSNLNPSHYPTQVDRSLSPSSGAGERSQNFSSPPGGPVMGGGMRGDGRDSRGDHGGGARPQEGPPGANLFIYHLPNDLTDADLATAFAPFGHVVSAKVFLDKRTQESKGFGFVSYNHPAEAEVAISKMNGFQIGSKRLKVQHKKADHGDREHESPLRYPGHHGPPRDMQGPMQQQQQSMAPLHGGSGRLGMGYGGGSGGGGGGGGPPDASPELRGYHSHSHSSDSKVMYTGGGDTRTIYAGPVPSSSYDGGGGRGGGGMPEDSTSGGGGYRVNVKPGPVGLGSAGGGGDGGGGGGGIEGGGDGSSAAQTGGGMYHPDGGGGGEGGL